MKKTGSQIQSQKIVCQFHPPALGIVYKQGDKKTKLYKIQFNEMIQINDAEKITQLLFRNYYLHINEDSVPYEQLFNAVVLILSKQFLNQKSSSLSFSQKRQSPFTYSNECLDDDIELI